MKYEDAIKLITGKSNFYIDLGLDRISAVLDKFGNPENSLKFIHVAGTNGKGSVCTMLASIFRKQDTRQDFIQVRISGSILKGLRLTAQIFRRKLLLNMFR